ncbi:E3 ubiquitin-protein ligase SHPRH [Anabrus simplex]|uniref:E3 ubiquitin-protein ligase SHPRH n=1 Tax=Anabrus simplex TaxID=316456 RepID=UPI0035A30F6C
MVKRKSAAPQRLSGETRSIRTWNLASTSTETAPGVITVSDSEDVPQIKRQRCRKKVRKRCSEDNSQDPFLQEILSYCEFYVTVKRYIVAENDRVFHLGNITLELSGGNRMLPTHDLFWLYISKIPGCSFLYYDTKDTVDYHLIKGSVDVDLFTGLSSRCFGLQFEDPGDNADYLSIRVLLFESLCKSPASPKQTKLRSIVLSHFGSLSLPDVDDVGPTESKHDIEDLYRVIKSYHEMDDIHCTAEIQHPSLIPELRPYQLHAVQWMLQRESNPTCETKILDPLFVEMSTQCGQTLYYNRYSGCVVLEKPIASPLPTGGILADEMGLGKTVEVLALILANPRNIPDKEKLAGTSDMCVKVVANVTQVSNVKSECDNEVVKSFDNSDKNSVMAALPESASSPKSTPRSRKNCGKVVKYGGSRKCRKQGRDTVRECIEAVITTHCYNGSKAEARKATGTHKAEKKRGSLRQMLEEWYEELLLETIKKSVRILPSSSDLECVCGEERSNLPRVQCSICRHWQHSQCVGNPNRGSYLCPRCWRNEEPVVSGATLIVSPSSISGQWLSEIQKHIRGDFSVLTYRGVQKDGFLQPYDLASYKLVLTTYETLRKELVHAELNDSSSPRLRHSKRFFAAPSPLAFVQWWRVCLDEAQMVEHTASKTAEMARRLESVHRWAITGTPIQKSIQDLFGLMQFLGVEPYNVQRFWTGVLYAPFCRGDRIPLHNLLKQILWRSMKCDLLDQINIPPQSQQIHWLNFSPVEEHFYRLQHMLCSDDFVFLSVRFGGVDIPLRSLDRNSIHKMLTPLLRLRQACTHHQVVRGFHISQKATMTMDELLESLIKKTKLESEEALRQIIAALNGLAGINIIRELWPQAAELYRDVLRLSEEYKGSLKIDALQLIHTMHNLSDILCVHREVIPATLRDHVLHEQALELEQKYMRKCDSQVASAQESLSTLSLAVRHHENNFQVGRDEWWAELLEWITVHDDKAELLSRVHLDLMDDRVPGQPSIVNRVKSIAGMENELALWSKSLCLARNKALKSLRDLELLQPLDLVNEAVECHLRTNISKKGKCRICGCETLLKTYESLLFAVSSKQTEHSLVGDVLMLGQLNKGTWKACEHERVIRVLVAYVRGKRADKECIEDAATYLKWLESLKKEFKQLRHTWTQLRDQVSVQDELHMAKLRLRVRFPDEPRVQSPRKHNPLKQLSSNLTNKVETIHIIEHHEVSAHEARLNSDRMQAQDELRRKTGQLQYLKNLGKNQGCKSNPDPCPICHTELGDKWSVLQCGHCFCIECIRLLMQSTGGLRMTSVKCPICRDVTHSGDISFVDISTKNPDQGLWSNISVKGSHSTKVEAVVRCLLALQNTEPGAKALVFSTWEKVLDVLENALEENSIVFRRLKPGVKYQQNLREFKEEPNNVMALLMPVHWGAKGLNLTEATHVLLVEPILNPANELQAIGRVHRIGQTKKTVVHRFLVRGTIEERIHEAVQSSVEDWSEDCVTIGQLRDLFNGFTEDIGLNSERKILTPSNKLPLENGASNRTLPCSVAASSSMSVCSIAATSMASGHMITQEGRASLLSESYKNSPVCFRNMNLSDSCKQDGGQCSSSSTNMAMQANFLSADHSDMTTVENTEQISVNKSGSSVLLEPRLSNCSNEVVLTDNSQFEVVLNGGSSTASNIGPCIFEHNSDITLNKEFPVVDDSVVTASHSVRCDKFSPTKNTDFDSKECVLSSDSTLRSDNTPVDISFSSVSSGERNQETGPRRFPHMEFPLSSNEIMTVNIPAQNEISGKFVRKAILKDSFSDCTSLVTSECELPKELMATSSVKESSGNTKPDVLHMESSVSSPASVLFSAPDEALTVGSFVEIPEEDSSNSFVADTPTESGSISSLQCNVPEAAMPSGKYLEMPAPVLLDVSEEAIPVGGYVEISTQEDSNSNISSETKSSSPAASVLPNPVPVGDYIEIPASVLLNVSDKNVPVSGYLEVPNGEDSALPVGLSVDVSDEIVSTQRCFEIPLGEYLSTSVGETLSSSTLSDEGVSTGEDSNSMLVTESATPPLRTVTSRSSLSDGNHISFVAKIGDSGEMLPSVATSTNAFISAVKPGVPINRNTSGEITLGGILSPPYSPVSTGASLNHSL